MKSTFLCLLALLATVPERVYFEQPVTWFEEVASSARVASDGRAALYGSRGRVKLIDLASGREDAAGLNGLEAVTDAQYLPRGGIALQGRNGSEQGWFLPTAAGLRLSSLPADAAPQWSPDGEAVAFYRRGEPQAGLFVGDPANPRRRLSAQRVIGLAWAPDGRFVYAIVCEETGASRIVRVPRGEGDDVVVSRNLDAAPRSSSLAVSADGERLYVALVSPGPPDNEARHRPDVDRDLDVYEVGVGGGAPRIVVQHPGDDFAPNVVGDQLYWTRVQVQESVVVFPAAGGVAKEIVADAEGPSWRGDGRQIGFTYGGWRIADWALNLDGGVADFDPVRGEGSGRRAMVSGYHEDFGPTWSPDGKWIAFHSHRSPTPVIEYGGAGSTDDIYLRAASGGPTIRLTTSAWECGTPDWSPDGRRLVFTGWEKGGTPGRSLPWIVSLDPASGAPGALAKLPLPSEIAGAEWASWSPKGDEIALEVEAAPGRHALWVVRADGSQGEKRVEYDMLTYGGVDWTPDAKSLVYAALVDGRMQIFTVGSDGTSARQLTRDADHLFQPQVSPDGRFIACTRMRQQKEIWKTKLPHAR